MFQSQDIEPMLKKCKPLLHSKETIKRNDIEDITAEL